MIKFFGNIRKKILKEGKTTQYLKYALGEIVLVVLGILIALQINNWNEQRKETHRARALLKGMADELKADTLYLHAHIDLYQKQCKNCAELLSDSIFGNISSDSLFTMLPLNQTLLTLNTQSFEKIKNTGITNLLGYPDLEKDISWYYIMTAKYHKAQMAWEEKATDRDEEFWFNSTTIGTPNMLSPFFIDTIPFRQDEKTRKQELVAVINSMEGRKRIRSAMYRKQLILYTMKDRKKFAKGMLIWLNEHL